MWLVFVMYALFASVFTIAKITLNYAQPFFLLGSRMAVAGLLLLAYQYIFNRQALRISRTLVKSLAIVAFFNFYLTNVLEFWGLQYLTSSKACFIYSLSPFISALLSYVIFSEKLTAKKWLGLGLGFLGMIPIFMASSGTENLLKNYLFFSTAELALLGAVFCSCYGWSGMHTLRKENYSALSANGIGMFFAGIMSLMTSAVFERWNPVPVTDWAPVLEGSLYMLIVSNLLAYNFYSYLLKRFTITFMSFAGFSTPLFVSVFGYFFLGEKLEVAFFMSAAVVFCGLYLFNRDELKQKGVAVKSEA